MAPKYKLTYFQVKGTGEPIRFLLSYMDADFEDVRYKYEEWPKFKHIAPYGKLPILEIDGKTVCQSLAIMRYLGNKAGLAGKDEWENLQIDMIVDIFADFRKEQLDYLMEKDEKLKAEKLTKITKETEPFYFEKIDQTIKDNNGYLANKKLSWADLWIIGLIYGSKEYFTYNITKFPNLNKLYEKVLAIPNIKAWIEKHP